MDQINKSKNILKILPWYMGISKFKPIANNNAWYNFNNNKHNISTIYSKNYEENW